MNFRIRSEKQEIMDDPNLDLLTLKDVFIDINKVNTILNGYAVTLKAIEKMLDTHPQNSYTLMDLGCGDGDMLKQIAHYFKARTASLNLIGIDLNENAIKIATENCKAFPNISFLRQDVLTWDTDAPSCDILLCTLTMHHFSEEEISIFLKKIIQLPRIGIIINDLQRSKLSYFLFKVFSTVFIRTDIAKYDGLLSIKRAFTKLELIAYSKEFPHITHQIKWKWAFRYLWVMQLKKEQISYEQN